MCIGIKCFMPNGILESFGWTCEVTIINLVLVDAIKFMKMAPIDQECAFHESLENTNKVESPCKGPCNGICYYHLFGQPWDNKISGTGHNLAETNVL